MPYTFFFSYARENYSPYLLKFFKDLYGEVRLRKGDQDQICFFDQKSIKLGERWDEELLKALQESSILVPLYSPAYFKSHYCGLEWQVFRMKEEAARRTHGGNASLPSIIKPVVWHRPDALPRVVAQFQYTLGMQSDVYNHWGLHEICKQSSGKHKTAYHDFLRMFADEIMATARTLRDNAPRPRVQITLEEVKNPFLEDSALRMQHGSPHSGPKFVYFILVSQGIDWKPYLPPEPTPIGPMVQHVASDPKMNYSSNIVLGGLDYELVEKIRQAEKARNIVIVFIDGPHAELYQGQLEQLDKQNFFNCSIFVPWNKLDPAVGEHVGELRGVVRALLERWATTKHSVYFHDEVYSAAQLSDELRETLISLEANIVNTAEVSPGRHLTRGAAPRIENTAK